MTITAKIRKVDVVREGLEREILTTLSTCEGNRFVSKRASVADMRLGLTTTECSNTTFRRVLSGLIKRGAVVWSRPHQQHIGDDERPITIRLAPKKVPEPAQKQHSFRPYFV